MKYLDYPELELLSRKLTFESAECKVFTRLEAYSCKSVSKEKRVFKSLESAYAQSASQSPPDYLDEVLASPFGRLDQPAALKTLFLLIATLNSAFPDHDFSQANPLDFRREASSAGVLNSLSTTLLSLRSNSSAPRSYSSLPSSHDGLNLDSALMSRSSGSGSSPHFGPQRTVINHPTLATVLDEIMSIPECEVFTYHPDAESDPHASAEPDEEGSSLDDEAYWSGDDDTHMTSLDLGTPRGWRDAEDAPMFDEDVYGGGFGPGNVPSSHPSSAPAVPSTPTSARRRGLQHGSTKRDTAPSGYAPADEEDEDNDDDYIDGAAGLLWATYAFFYNRKLKRILFVSVWSRRNPKFGLAPSMPTFSPPSTVASHADGNAVNARAGSRMAPIQVPDDDAGSVQTPNPSPAKRAIARSLHGRRRRGRTSSGSPAPSSLSPFKYGREVEVGRTPASSGVALVRPPSGRTGGFLSLDHTVMSSSAPPAGTAAVHHAASTAAGQTSGGEKRAGEVTPAVAKKARTSAPSA